MTTNVWGEPLLYKASSGTPLARWRITWVIPVEDYHPKGFDGTMAREFHDEGDFKEHLALLNEAEGYKECRDIKAYDREITVGPWKET